MITKIDYLFKNLDGESVIYSVEINKDGVKSIMYDNPNDCCIVEFNDGRIDRIYYPTKIYID